MKAQNPITQSNKFKYKGSETMINAFTYILFKEIKSFITGFAVALLINVLWAVIEKKTYGVVKPFWYHDVITLVIMISVPINFVLIAYIKNLLQNGRKANEGK